MKAKTLHYFSGIFIAAFVFLHLSNHFCALFGAQAHLAYMDYLRLLYRNILVESLLLGAVLVQIVSGIRLFRARYRQAISFFDRLQIWSGLYLAFFFSVHLSAVFAGRFILHLDTNFYFGVAGLNTFPYFFFFVPYYGLAIWSFFGHIAAIHQQKMQASFLGFSPAQQASGIFWLGFVLACLTLYGLTNGFAGVPIPSAYKVLVGG